MLQEMLLNPAEKIRTFKAEKHSHLEWQISPECDKYWDESIILTVTKCLCLCYRAPATELKVPVIA